MGGGVRCSWTPKAPGAFHLQADVSCEGNVLEIYMKNNTAEIGLAVK